LKRYLVKLTAIVLSLLLLSGCSGISMESIGDFLSGSNAEESETPEPEITPEQDTAEPDEKQEMAAESVMSAAEAPDILRLSYQESYGLNPFTTVSLSNRTILSLLYEPLFLVNDRFQAEPVLATGMEVSEDGLTTTVSLRQDVKFHNGKRMTANDVLYSYQLAKESDYYGNRFIHVDSVDVKNSHTIVITTDTSYEDISLLLDFPIVREGTSGPIPVDEEDEEAEAEIPQLDPSTLVPEGTGPFVYDESYSLRRFADWWQEDYFLGYNAAALTSCTTAADIRDQFEYGQVNLVCTDPSSAAYATYHSDLELWSCPTTVMQYIGFNQNDKVFGVDAVRACVTYVINREEIVAEDLGGFALAASLPASPLSPSYDAGLAADYGLNMTAFQELLDEAEIQDYTADGILDVFVKEYSLPLAGTMIVNAASNQRVATANRIADALNSVGFNITVDVMEESEYRNALRYQNYDLYYGEIRMSPNFDMGSFFREQGSANYGGMVSGTGVSLCAAMLENSGNSYDLHKWVMDKGYLCPVLFKSYAVYTTRGAAADLSPAVDWVIH